MKHRGREKQKLTMCQCPPVPGRLRTQFSKNMDGVNVGSELRPSRRRVAVAVGSTRQSWNFALFVLFFSSFSRWTFTNVQIFLIACTMKWILRIQ